MTTVALRCFPKFKFEFPRVDLIKVIDFTSPKGMINHASIAYSQCTTCKFLKPIPNQKATPKCCMAMFKDLS